MTHARDELTGQVLGGYRVDALLWAGASRRVYRARQLTVGRDVALEFPSRAAALEGDPGREFVARARAAARRGNHPRLVRIHDAVRHGDDVFCSMELVSGGSLAARVRQSGALGWREFRPLLLDALEALSLAAAEGSVHGEVDPTRLLLTRDGHAKVSPLLFGPTGESPRIIELPALPFLAPEVIRGGGAGPSADVYGVAASAWYALSGKLPFRGASFAGIVRSKERGAKALPPLPPGVPEVVRDALAESLSPSPALRPADVRELLARLRDPAARGAVTGESRAWLGRASIGVAALAVIVVIALFLGPRGDEPGADSDRDTRTPEELADGGTEDSSRGRPGPGPADRSGASGDDDASTDDVRELLSTLSSRTDEGLRELSELEEAWRDDLPTLSAARRAVADLRAKYDDETVDRGARTLLTTVESKVYGRVRRYAERAATAGHFRDALESLERASKEFPSRREETEAEVRRVEVRAEARADELAAAADRALARDEIDAAITRLDSLQDRFPPSGRETIVAAIARLVSRREGVDGVVARARDAVSRARLLVAGGDFDAAHEALRASGAEASAVEGDAALASAWREVELSSAAWSSILAELDRRSGRGTVRALAPVVAVTSEGGAASAATTRTIVDARLRSVRPGSGELPSLRLEAPDGTRFACALLDLPNEGLVDLAVSSGDVTSAPNPAEAVEGVGLVLYHLAGAERALEVLTEDPRLPAGVRLDHADSIPRRAVARLDRAIDELERRTSAADPRDVDEWEDAIEHIARAVDLHGPLAADSPVRQRVVDAHRAMARGRLGARGAEALFAGDVDESSRGISITWRFDSDAVLGDFVRVGGGEGSELRIEDGDLVLNGECRIGHGEPFRERLAVGVVVTAYDERAPNVNLALWTSADDHVTYPGEHDDAKGARDAPLGDYLAFGVGYSPSKKGSSVRLREVGSDRSLSVPALTLLGGARGEPLHVAYFRHRFGCLWGETVSRRFRGPLSVQVELTPDRFVWNVAGRSLHDQAGRVLRQVRPDASRAAARGSVSFFTNGSVVRFREVRLAAKLDPWWVDAERARLVDESVAAFESSWRTE